MCLYAVRMISSQSLYFTGYLSTLFPLLSDQRDVSLTDNVASDFSDLLRFLLFQSSKIPSVTECMMA